MSEHSHKQFYTTSHIKSLETSIGKPLFVRQARGVEATTVAHDLALQVASHIDIVEEKLTSVKQRNNNIYGTLNIAGPAEYLSFSFGEQISRLLHDNKLSVVMHIGNKVDIYQALESGVVDLAVTASRPDPSHFSYHVLEQETLVLVVSKALYQKLGDQKITAELLAQFSVVSYDEELPLTRMYFESIFNQPCTSPISAICPDLRTIASIVSHGGGYSVLPDYLCDTYLKAGSLHMIGPPGPKNTLYLVWRKGALKHARVQFAKDLILGHAVENSGEENVAE